MITNKISHDLQIDLCILALSLNNLKNYSYINLHWEILVLTHLKEGKITEEQPIKTSEVHKLQEKDLENVV